MTGAVRLGTSSWSWKEWVGPFYPTDTKPGDYLVEYSRHFDTVETDATYYRIPTLSMVQGWADKTPDGFRMAAKFPRSICHAGHKATPDPEKLLSIEHTAKDRDDFLRAMRALGDRRGPLVLQFPYFNKRVFPHSGPFLERLDLYLASLAPDFRYAVEIRNRWWIKADLLEILRRNSAALVLVDQAWMPHGDEIPERLDPITTDFSYIRLLGDRKEIEEITKTWEKEVLPHTGRLERWARLIRSFRDRVPETFAFANNHYAGHAPTTVRRLSELIDTVPDPISTLPPSDPTTRE